MPSKIAIIGAGFAGVWSALSARRLINLKHKEKNVDILVISPEPSLVMRPRLYEANAAGMNYPLGDLFGSAGIKFLQGTVDTIQIETHSVKVQTASGGEEIVRPRGVTGLEEHAFDIDTLTSAAKLESHLEGLTSLPSSPARDTIVVCGGGFTGIELAAELPKRLSQHKGARIILVEGADEIGPELGPGPRPTILKALEDLNVEIKLKSRVAAVDSKGVTLASGERIETLTAIWTAGQRATPLTEQIPGAKDSLSRLYVDENLRVPSTEDVFATGDAAYALADTKGHYALMSCQHALALGRVSGHNAAADLLNEPNVAYSQPGYNCCLDLGGWGAVISRDWDRNEQITGDLAKRGKTFINQKVIYPPGNVKEAILAADPATPTGDAHFKILLEAMA
ncbi:Pyr-redox-2 domain-containing protein [Fusarium sp. LHS14.1]|nr:Pyr-redox-2 domain-containing protein [Fusarium sp. LHS14.1]